METKVREDHNGWHAYIQLLEKVGLAAYLNSYSSPDYPSLFISTDKMGRLVRLVETVYRIKLTTKDKAKIRAMRTPRQICEDLGNILSPNSYPDLRSDYPPDPAVKPSA